jgi:hypothetical protein
VTALAYKSQTIPLVAANKFFPVSDEGNLFDEALELSKTRIEGFFTTPSVETEIDKSFNSETVIFNPGEQKDLVRFIQNTPYRQKTSISSQKWKGYVVDKGPEYFKAIITDISKTNQDEEVEIPLKAISQDDLHLVIEGARFDWHIGYEKLSGTTQKYSKILFRRMPRWTLSEFERAKSLKQKFKEFLSNQSI